MAASDLVVTGEGSLDAQSLRGKGAVNVARLAMARGLDCAMVCGRIDLDATSLRSIGVTTWGALTDIAAESEAMSSAPALLARRTIEVLADLH